MRNMIFESQGTDLLAKMLAFYKKRYPSQPEMEEKFNDAVEDLISERDITRGEYTKFCIDNDIEPRPKKSSKFGGSAGGGGSRGGGGC